MKNLLCLLGVCLVIWPALAQSNDYYNRMNHVFGAIDKSKVTTGLLKEFGIRLNEVEAYNGMLISANESRQPFKQKVTLHINGLLTYLE